MIGVVIHLWSSDSTIISILEFRFPIFRFLPDCFDFTLILSSFIPFAITILKKEAR